MLWSHGIVVNPSKGILLVEGHGDNEVKCIATSGLKVVGGENFSNSFLVSGFSTDYNNLILVKVRGRRANGAFIVDVKLDSDGRPLADKEKNWIPKSDRALASVDKEGYIEWHFGDRVFSTDPKRKDGVFYVSDPGVFLSYLIGRIPWDAVFQSAEETQKQIDLQQRCTHLENEAKYLQEMLDRSEETNLSLSKELELSVVNEYGLKEKKSRLIEAHETKCASLQKDMRDWKEAATQLRDAVNSPFLTIAEKKCVEMHGAPIFELRSARIKEALSLFPDKSLYDSY